MKPTQRPRCSPLVAAAYLRKERQLTTAAVAMEGTAAPQVADRRARAWELVQEHLHHSLGCEPYLRDAAYRWMLASARTRDSLDVYVRRFARFCRDSDRRSLSAHTDAAPDDVGGWLYDLEAQGLAARTVCHHRDVLRSWFSWLAERDLIRRSPITRDLRRAFRIDPGAVCKADGTRQALTLAEAQRLVSWALGDAIPAAGLSVLLQAVGGLRSVEVARLERRHLVEREGVWTLTIPGKGERTRQITLEEPVVRAWSRYARALRRQGERGPLLRRPGGGHYDRRTVQRWAKEAAAVVGREGEISSHDLRKTAVTLLMEGGATLDEARLYAGHTSPTTTARCYVTRRRRMQATTGLRVDNTEHHQPTKATP